MADVKKLQTRIALKYDTYANWTDATKEGLGANLVLLKGELGICAIEDKAQGAQTAPTVLFKVGDGETPFKSLKWASALAADVYGWAKASDVRLTGKSIEFVGGKDTDGNDVIVKTVAINYATPEEVAAAVKVVSDDLDKLAARVATVEGLFDGDDSVGNKIAGLDSRLGDAEAAIEAINDEADGILATAKAYAEAQDASLKTELQGYADQAEADAISAAETASEAKVAIERARISAVEGRATAVEGRLDVIEGEAEGSIKKAAADALASAQSYADGKANDAQSAAQGYADGVAATAKSEAIAAAKSETESQVAAINSTLSAEDARLAGLIGDNADAIAAEASTRATAISDVTTAYTTAIATAKQEAVDAAAADAKSKVDALAATVGENTAAIASHNTAVAAEISRVEGLVTTEKNRAEGIEADFEDRITAMEAFFDGAAKDEGEGENLKNALDTLVEIQTYISNDGQAGKDLLDAVDANAEAIEALGGRMDDAEDGIEALEGRATALEGRADALETLTAGFDGTIKAAVEAAAAKGQTGIDNAATAQAAAEAADGKAVDAQTRVGALEAEVPGIKTTAETAAAGVTALEGRMDTAEGKIEALEAASATHALKTDVENEFKNYVKTADYEADKAATEQALGNVYTKEESDGKFALITAVEANATEIGKNAAAIAKNAGDISTNATAISDEASRAAGQEAAIRSEFATADQGIYDKIGDVGTGTVAAAIDAAKNAAIADAEGKVNALAGDAVAKNTAAVAAVSGRVDALEDRFSGWFVIDCGSASTVIDETK